MLMEYVGFTSFRERDVHFIEFHVRLSICLPCADLVAY